MPLVTGASLRIRTASLADEQAIVALLRERDQREHPAAAIMSYLAGLDPSQICVWLAEREGEPVGINAIYLRTLDTLDGLARVGYWAHLYVQPAARKLMIYPRFVLDMMAWGRREGLQLIYTGSRQQHVAAAHMRMGFENVVTLPVLLQPLRPAALICGRRGIRSKFLRTAAHAMDNAYRGVCRAITTRGATAFEEMAPCNLPSNAVSAFCGVGDGMVRTQWTPDEWRARFSTTIEGEEYRAYVGPGGSPAAAGALMRLAERGDPPVRVGVLMDVFDNTQEKRHIHDVLKKVAIAADEAGAAAMIAVEPRAATIAEAMRACGYWRSPERYAIVAKQTDGGKLPSRLSDPSAWHFSFAEHDAF